MGDKLVTTHFGTGTLGFAPAADMKPVVSMDGTVDLIGAAVNAGAVCVRPGTEIAFDEPVKLSTPDMAGDFRIADFHEKKYQTAIFRQINKNVELSHHDALEFPGGEVHCLTFLKIGQHATVLQLPAMPKTEQEVEAQTRLPIAG